MADQKHRQRSPHGDGFLKPVATSCYSRVKNRNGARPVASDETFFLTITCLCRRDHEPIRSFQHTIAFLIKVEVGVDGMPKGPIVGNTSCWYGNLRYLTQNVTDPKAKLLKKYNKKKKQFTSVNVGPKIVKKALYDWCQICGVNAEKANNAWARKTFINVALHELLLPEQMVMNVSGHRSAAQMRADYCGNRKQTTKNHCMPSGRPQTLTAGRERRSRCTST